VNEDDYEIFQSNMVYAILPSKRVAGSPESEDAGAAVPVAFAVTDNLAFKISNFLSNEYDREHPACAGCAAFGDPVWEGEINPGMNRTDEGWYHYTGGIHPFKDKYIWCAAKNKPSSSEMNRGDTEDPDPVRAGGPYDEIPDNVDAGDIVYTINPSSAADRKLMGLKFALKANVAGVATREGSKTVSNTKILSDDWNLLARIRDMINKPVKADVKLARPTMGEDTVNFHLKCLAGRILTLVDAMISGEGQNKAFKTYVKKEFREQFHRVFGFFHDDGNCAEASKPEELEIAEREF